MKPVVYAKRLLKLAAFLEALPKERFDYRTWSNGDFCDPNKRPPSCGTTACALGWAVSMPDFKAAARRQGHTVGLRASWVDGAGNGGTGKWAYEVVVDGSSRPGTEALNGNGIEVEVLNGDGEIVWERFYFGDEAASGILFGLNADEHEHLFVPFSSADERASGADVARKIRKFVAMKYGEVK